MDKFSEQKIEQILQSLADIQPSTESAGRVQENVRALVADRCRSDARPFLQRHWRPVSAMAAAALIAIGLLMFFRPTPPSPTPVRLVSEGPAKLSPTSLGSLNAAFEQGGMEAVEKLFKEFMKLKKPVPEIKSIDDATNGQFEKEN